SELSEPAKRNCELLTAHARRVGQVDLVYKIGLDVAAASLPKLSPNQRQRLIEPPMVHWTARNVAPRQANPLLPGLWGISEGHIAHRGGGGFGGLALRFPLAGEFEFSFDAFTSPDSRCGVSYGGITHVTNFAGGPISIASTSSDDQINRP